MTNVLEDSKKKDRKIPMFGWICHNQYLIFGTDDDKNDGDGVNDYGGWGGGVVEKDNQ